MENNALGKRNYFVKLKESWVSVLQLGGGGGGGERGWLLGVEGFRGLAEEEEEKCFFFLSTLLLAKKLKLHVFN